MQEDKLSKQIADSLKNHQESNPHPYELGAWERFDQKRKADKRKAWLQWVSGIAASLLLLAALYLVIDTNQSIQDTELLSTNSKTGISQDSVNSTKSDDSQSLAGNPSDTSVESENKIDQFDTAPQSKSATSDLIAAAEPSQQNTGSVTESQTKGTTKALPNKQVENNTSVPITTNLSREAEQTSVVAQNQESTIANNSSSEKSIESSVGNAVADNQVRESKQENLIAWTEESEIKEIPKDKSEWSFGLGVAPGYGASQQEGANVSSSTLGLGFLVDLDLPGKLTLSSGLGLNLLNQENQANSSYSNAFASSVAPSTETIVVRQTQVEIPLYVRYPVTRNNSVTVQAGFSNFYAFSQKAEQKTSFSRSVTVAAMDAAGLNSYKTVNENVVQSRTLEPVESKFYPFATMNFGLNLRVLQSEKSSYVLMPFYNYPLTQFTGFGDNPGFFGASFKVNFGGGSNQEKQ